jgi:probable phosphoglycerate mutase
MHIDLFQRLVINTASVTAFAFQAMGPRLLAYNDTGSLEHVRPQPEEEQATPKDTAEETTQDKGE